VRHLLAGYDLSTDRLYGHVVARKGRTEFLTFCRYLRSLHPAKVRIAIILDNFSPHLSTKTDPRVRDWAQANNSLLIVTWDEDDNSSGNRIATIIYGAQVKPGRYAEPVSHYNVLSTIEEMYGLPKTGLAANAPPITDIR